MQRLFLKILPLFALVSLAISHSAPAQTSGFRLKTADSLFQAKRYTQSLEHYEEILRQRQYSPAMLLKMAYIHEGLNNIGSAMYYLNLYYIATADETVVDKMDELATKFDLEGYVAARLRACRVAQVDLLGLDTYSFEHRYYSFRRATHRGEANYGRQASLIGLA